MEKDSENNPNSADKDYGFPFVKAEPLKNSPHHEVSGQPENIKEKGSLQSESLAESGTVPTTIKFGSSEKLGNKKKSQAPLLLSLVFLIIIILASMAYFLYYLPLQSELPETPAIVEDKLEEPQIRPEVIIEVPVESDNDSIGAEVMETPAAEVQTPTIASPSGGNLLILNAKEDVRSYHLVVASLPNERIAREEAQVFLDKGKDIWLIFPSGDTRNYRLSVGKYSSFKTASEALAAAKADYNESTWILKY